MPDKRVLSPTSDPFDLAAELFLSAKTAEHCTAWTLRAYRRAVLRFVVWLKEQGIRTPQSITPAHVRGYLAHLTDLGLKASSVHDYARPVKTWLRFLYSENILPDNPTARVKLPRVADGILPAFEAADVRQLLEACKDSQDSERAASGGGGRWWRAAS